MTNNYTFEVPALCVDVLKQNHALIAGSTGSGKSVFLDSLIFTAIADGNKALVLIDPKRVDLRKWRKCAAVIEYAAEHRDIMHTLNKCVAIMEERFRDMERKDLVKTDRKHIYIVVDELADLLMSEYHKDIENALQRLAQLGRAAGIHLILATQSPSRQTLKASIILNITARVGLHCMSAIESKQVINRKGLEELPQYGKCIYFDGATYYDPVNVLMMSKEEQDTLIRIAS